MKTTLFFISCVISASALAEESHTSPAQLTTNEIKLAREAVRKHEVTLNNNWKKRLALALKNDKSGDGLKRPYYGDYKQGH